MTNIVAEKLALLSDSPGVYIMKNEQGKVIYVGKAVVLKNRVRQYFQSSKNHPPKVQAMVAKIADFETILTRSEVEALILEANLIKKFRPYYNIRLKDDKTYPYVKVTMAEDYPRVVITRRILRDGAKYFGPYANVGALRESLKLLQRLFPMRTCKNMNVDRPCLEYHIKRCVAPCAGKYSRDEYMEMAKAVCLYLEGRTSDVEKMLETRMNEAAAGLRFESAAKLRDQLKAVRKVAERQNVVTGSGDQDVIGIARTDAGICVMVFFIRAGKMTGREHFMLSGGEDERDDDILSAFLKQYYSRAAFLPEEVLLPFECESGIIEIWLTEMKGSKVQVIVPQRGLKRDIVLMAEENAKKYLHDEAARLKASEEQTMGAVRELQKYLGLKELPYRMECFDISHIQGSETVASMVVFEGGVAKKSDYRRFKIKSTEGKPDDFLSMREVTTRRYGKKTVENMPDLIVIDGGKGQLSSALEIIRGAGHTDVPVVGLAKQFEWIFVEGESDPVILPRHSQALFLMQRIRDEAHRFAITYHRKLRGKRNLVSVLDNIEGIGPNRRKSLFEHFGSLEKIKAAGEDELCAAPKMTKAAARAVYNFFAVRKT